MAFRTVVRKSASATIGVAAFAAPCALAFVPSATFTICSPHTGDNVSVTCSTTDHGGMLGGAGTVGATPVSQPGGLRGRME
jgi:hypothetical protein